MCELLADRPDLKIYGHLPIVAILRGIQPHEAISIGKALIDVGITLIEVPLNSPSPLQSISNLVNEFGSKALIGAGTVTNSLQVDQVAKVGGKLIVSPNTDIQVIRRTKEQKLLSFPGVATPTEAFTALNAGADGLKLFPCDLISPAAVKAIKTVLPEQTHLLSVGGVSTENMNSYLKAGVSGFGFGSALYKPGWNAKKVQSIGRAISAKFIEFHSSHELEEQP